MTSLSDVEVPSYIFNSRYMSFQMCTKLEQLSSQFRNFAKKYYSSLEVILLRSGDYDYTLRHRKAFEALIKKLAIYCPQLHLLDALIFHFGFNNVEDPNDENLNLHLVDFSALSVTNICLNYPHFSPVFNYEKITNLELSINDATDEQIVDLASTLRLCINLKSLNLFFHSYENLGETPILIGSIDSLEYLERFLIELDTEALDCDEIGEVEVFCHNLHCLSIRFVDIEPLINLCPLLSNLRHLNLCCSIDELDPTKLFRKMCTLQTLSITDYQNSDENSLNQGSVRMKFTRSETNGRLPWELSKVEVELEPYFMSDGRKIYDRNLHVYPVAHYLERIFEKVGQFVKKLKLSIYHSDTNRDDISYTNVPFLQVLSKYCLNLESFHYEANGIALEECIFAAKGFKQLLELTFDPRFKNSSVDGESIGMTVELIEPFVKHCTLLQKVKFYVSRRLRAEKLGFVVGEMHPLLQQWSGRVCFEIDESLKPRYVRCFEM